MNLSKRSLDSTLKKSKFASLLNKDIFEELPFFYKKSVFTFLNNLDREMDGKPFTNELLNKSLLKVILTISPEISIDKNFSNINSKPNS
jgi:hypothetical protein